MIRRVVESEGKLLCPVCDKVGVEFVRLTSRGRFHSVRCVKHKKVLGEWYE